MDAQPTFAHLIKQHVAQDGRYARQLAAATAARFGKAQAVSHSSISRWLRGAAKKAAQLGGYRQARRSFTTFPR